MRGGRGVKRTHSIQRNALQPAALTPNKQQEVLQNSSFMLSLLSVLQYELIIVS
jgi:hypothetical protein